jgi:hypothetical protein
MKTEEQIISGIERLREKRGSVPSIGRDWAEFNGAMKALAWLIDEVAFPVSGEGALGVLYASAHEAEKGKPQ